MMKKWFGKLLPPFLVCAAAAAAVLIGTAYFDFISQKIYEDSTGHLKEIYGQVNRSFGSFVEKNWGLLESWSDHFSEEDDDETAAFLKREQEYWGFSEFYFLSADKACMTPDGERSEMELGGAWDSLIGQEEPLMAGEVLPSGQEVTVFAVPAVHGEYKDFAYDAIAVSYTNADMASSLNVDAFSGKARCFVIHNDGQVLLSTQSGGNVFDNYLIYLRAASDLEEERLAQIQNDWEKGDAGLLQCKIGDVTHCILYQPVGYLDYVLLSVMPQSAISTGFLSVQNTTIAVLIVIFLLIGVTLAAMIAARIRRQSRRSRMELQYRERMFDVLSGSVDDIFIMLNAEDQNVDYISPNIERLVGIPVKEARKNIRVLEKCAVGQDIVIPRQELEEIPVHDSRGWECEYVHQSTGERRRSRCSATGCG